MADEQQQTAVEEGGAGDEAGEGVSRRGFLRSLMWASAGLAALQTLLAGLAMFWPRRVEGFGSRIVAGRVEDFPPGSVTRIRAGKFYISMFEGEFIALYWRCTHLGCTVPWVPEEGRFHCPCHGSIFERTGQNIAGPAPRPMDFMQSTVSNGRIIVDTGRIVQRDHHRPEHMTRLS